MKALSKLASFIFGMMDLGTTPRSSEPGPGAQRAAARLAAHRKAQAERLKDAAGPVMTRQQERHQARRGQKMPLGMKQADWHRQMGLPSIKRVRAA